MSPIAPQSRIEISRPCIYSYLLIYVTKHFRKALKWIQVSRVKWSSFLPHFISNFKQNRNQSKIFNKAPKSPRSTSINFIQSLDFMCEQPLFFNPSTKQELKFQLLPRPDADRTVYRRQHWRIRTEFDPIFLQQHFNAALACLIRDKQITIRSLSFLSPTASANWFVTGCKPTCTSRPHQFVRMRLGLPVLKYWPFL